MQILLCKVIINKQGVVTSWPECQRAAGKRLSLSFMPVEFLLYQLLEPAPGDFTITLGLFFFLSWLLELLLPF